MNPRTLLSPTVLAVAIFATSCTSAAARPAMSTTTVPIRFGTPQPNVDFRSATAVAEADVEATWTVNTVVDSSWSAGELRATTYMTSAYAAAIRTSTATKAAPGAVWMNWRAHQAATSVSTQVETDAAAPATTDTSTYVQVVATVTPVGAGGWVGTPEIWVTFVVLTKSSSASGWLVSSTETTQ